MENARPLFNCQPAAYTPWIGRSIKTLSQKMSHLWFAITLTHVNAFLYFFGRNVTDKVSNQKTLYMPPQLMCDSALPGKPGKLKMHFFTQMLYQCIARIQPVDPWFFQSFWLTTHTHVGVWLPKSCNQCVQFGLLGAWFRRTEVESATAIGLCSRPMHVHQCAVFLKEKCHMWCVW